MNNNITEKEVAFHWDQNADTWEDQVRKGYDLYREKLNNPAIFTLIGDVQDKTILDAGCGEGYNTRKLAQLGANICGVDISEKMIQKAKQEEGEAPLKIKYYVSSYSNLPQFKDGMFDMVVSFMALMDGPKYVEAIQEFYRILKSKGDLIISITHPCFLTPEIGWISNEHGEKIKITVGNYFSKEQFVEKWKFSKSPEAEGLPLFSVPRFPRTLSEYINPIIESGFMLKKINEPRPSEEACKEYPWLKRWRQHAAIYLHIHAKKNNLG